MTPQYLFLKKFNQKNMSTERESTTAGLAFKNKEEATQAVNTSINQLGKFGGFDIIATTVDGAQNLNPAKKALKSIFLSEEGYKKDRKALLARMKDWADLLEGADSPAEMLAQATEKTEETKKTLNKNTLTAVNAVKELEVNYRTVHSFYKNSGEAKLKNLTLVNADMEQITDMDNTTFFDAIAKELDDKYDRLDLRNNYGMVVLPGYLGSAAKVDRWARMAYENKVMMLTDFRDLETADDTMAMFELANHTGGDTYKSNVMMTCNWVVGRGKYEDLDEEEALFIPPSAGLAGRLYGTKMSQVCAGKKYGEIYEAEGTRFDLLHSEIGSLDKMGLIPMTKDYGKVLAFSSKTLYNGNNIGLQTYSVVRVFDWVAKSMMDYLNRMVFQNFNANTRKDIREEIVKFLDNNKGPDKLIEKFKILSFEQDPKQRDRVKLNIHMMPFFPARNFVIKLDGTKGDNPDSPDWNVECEDAGA
jgi:Type VI secretion system, TssC, VipB